MMLIKIKKTAEDYQKLPITETVIAVPAFFDDTQRGAVKEAAKLADLHALRISSDSTLAAIAHRLDMTVDDTRFVVFNVDDTLSIHVLEVDMGVFEYLSGAHDIPLPSSERTEEKLEFGYPIGTMDIPQAFPWSDTNTLIADMFERSIPYLERALKETNTSMEDITKLLVVGNSVHIPKFRPMLETYFRLNVSNIKDPQDSIVVGATIVARTLLGQSENGCGWLIEVNLLSLGIEAADGTMAKIMPRYSVIPSRKTQTFTTATDNQSSVFIKIFEGERALTKDNVFLGQFELSIPQAPRNMTHIEVQFEVDANSRLRVVACELSSGRCNGININEDINTRHDVETIDQMVREAEEQRTEDMLLLQLLQPIRALNGRL
jgi:molecular chaperone DnaK (HSP70)